jgi:hypothetical protein
LDFSLAIDSSRRLLQAEEVDHVRADVEYRHTDAAERHLEGLAQGRAAVTQGSDAHIFDEEIHQCVQVASIDGDGVTGDKLAYGLICREPVDEGLRGRHGVMVVMQFDVRATSIFSSL